MRHMVKCDPSSFREWPIGEFGMIAFKTVQVIDVARLTLVIAKRCQIKFGAMMFAVASRTGQLASRISRVRKAQRRVGGNGVFRQQGQIRGGHAMRQHCEFCVQAGVVTIHAQLRLRHRDVRAETYRVAYPVRQGFVARAMTGLSLIHI